MAVKRWIIFLSVFALSLTAIITLLIYFQAKQPFKEASETAESYLVQNNLIEKVVESYPYNSTNRYHTVVGITSEGEEKAFFVPSKDTEETIMEINLADGISKEDAISIAMAEVQGGKLLHAKLGVEEVGPVWEIAYVNQSDNLNYVYLLFENGDWWKRISNL